MAPNSAGGLSVWVVYDHPADYPDTYVARCWIDDRPTDSVIVSTDLEKIRDVLEIEMHLVKLMPMEGDDPTILETWL
jgi:hypothetical protein